VRSSDSTQRYSIAGEEEASTVTTVAAFLNYSSGEGVDPAEDPPYTFGGIDPEETGMIDDFRVGDYVWGAFAWYPYRPGAARAKQVPAATLKQRKRRTWFFAGRKGTGAQMHAHTPAFNSVVYGEKKWVLAPPGVSWALPSAVGQAARARPAGCRGGDCRGETSSAAVGPGGAAGRESSARWLVKHRAGASGATDHALLECTVHAGETLYIPDLWNHATINTKEVVGIAFELGPPHRRLLDPWHPFGKKTERGSSSRSTVSARDEL